MTITDTPGGTIPYAVDAVIFNPDDTVTIHYADPEQTSRNPKVRTASTMTVAFDTDENVTLTTISLLETVCDLIAFGREAQRAPSARIPGRT